MNYQDIIDKYYPAGTLRRDIYMRHCRSVAQEALAIAHRKHLSLSDEDITAAAMLHDIGIFLTNAPSLGCTGSEPYLMHGILGADLLRKEGMPEEIARVAERHTGAGLTADEIRAQHLPLPARDLLPETLLEQLICYADNFYSKSGDMQRKSLATVEKSMQRYGEGTMSRLRHLESLFE